MMWSTLRNKDGVAAVEFALIAPILILMIFGFMEYAHVSSARTRLEGATMRAARMVAASNCPSRRESMMASIISDAMRDLPSPDGGNVQIITRSYSDRFADVGESEPFADINGNGSWDSDESYTDLNGNGQFDQDMGTMNSLGGVGQVFSITARFRVQSLFLFIDDRFNGTGYYQLEASTVFRNEPIFSSAGCP
jgi:hypothetical protein